jgi:hypothetical protein
MSSAWENVMDAARRVSETLSPTRNVPMYAHFNRQQAPFSIQLSDMTLTYDEQQTWQFDGDVNAMTDNLRSKSQQVDKENQVLKCKISILLDMVKF